MMISPSLPPSLPLPLPLSPPPLLFSLPYHLPSLFSKNSGRK